ncbi:transcription-repair coupling factor [Corynebacterium ulceribovis]|uniref:transcription-repair coupling factor n=1 Tax=Corynebacterium ulceribovis TaxID=487732 RepID=UPI001FE20C3B|nr:transcription-repair coupling factor [Corynebacterium ulceribovis]
MPDPQDMSAVSAAPALSGLAQLIATDPKISGVLTHLGAPLLDMSGEDAVRPWLIAAIARKAPMLVVTATSRDAEELTAELTGILGDAVVQFPSWETLPHERLSPGVETVGKRVQILHRLAHPEHGGRIRVVVGTARSLVQPVMARLSDIAPLHLAEGVEIEQEELIRKLVEFGYRHADMVGKRGQFAVRGGLVDVFPSTADDPVRLDFWGDEISEMRPFSVGDQRTMPEAEISAVDVYPCRELLLDDEVTSRAAELALEHAGNAQLAEMLDKISQGTPVEGMEALIPVLHTGPLVTLPELMPEGAHVLLCGPERIRSRAIDLLAAGEEFRKAGWEAAAMGASAPVEAQNLDLSASEFRYFPDIEEQTRDAGMPWWRLSPPGLVPPGVSEGDLLPLDYEHGPAPRGDLSEIGKMMSALRTLTIADGRAAYVAATPAAGKRMLERFHEAGIKARAAKPAEEPARGQVTVYQAVLHGGLEVPKAGDTHVTLVADTDVTGNRVANIGSGKRRPAKRRNRVDPLALQPGDLVVHDSHGIGKFLELTERTVGTGSDTSRREYVVLEYAASTRGGPGDKLFVPMESLDLLSRYVGGEAPALSRMGGADWRNTKRKARSAVREIADELVKLYAERQSAEGHAFAPDSPWQREMEDNFPFTETEDQMQAIEEIKADMEKSSPMDRILIGDVGYGKTEVAVRAAFKAVQDGKQVAVLVPTTLLAQQHLATFTERMAGFPVTIRGLSRFTSTKEAKEILKGLSEGKVDIVIGTHRLLQTGVQWQNLGLVIVDEEQRFGVEHKEHIKSLRTHVDVLTMSATPIPRTLEMSMAGIRELSQILTPPQDRHPVLTYVGAYDEKQISAAIRRELLRDGQVFYIHNKVRTIDRAAAKIRELVPEARVVIAHGQMSEEQLEQTVQGFWNRDFDVLVCTTIVETGLDISNANTLIVENAHHMGLSQLHQLRGRVGRSRERGYAYFLYPADGTLTETSYDRLATIAANNDLGAGMAVAMKDLEMRGAGNVLGAEQSGHIAGVGFDLYVRLVGEAVGALKNAADGQPVNGSEAESTEVHIDLPVDANIPAEYINAERLRLEAYRKLAEARTPDDIDQVLAELKDRYGAWPKEVERLVAVARLRLLCRTFGVSDVSASGAHVSFKPLDLADSKQLRLKRLYPQSTYRPTTKVVNVHVPKVGQGLRAQPLRDIELVQWCADVLTALAGIPRMSVTGQPLPEPTPDPKPAAKAKSSATSAASARARARRARRRRD